MQFTRTKDSSGTPIFKRTKAEPKPIPIPKFPTSGRPPKYQKEDFPELAYRFLLLGLKEEEIAKFFEVTIVTLHEWRNIWPEFSKAWAAGGDPSLAKVAKRLLHRAVGYSHPDVRVFLVDHEETLPDGTQVKTKKPLIIEVTKHYPPDTDAAKFILFNRTKTKEADGTGLSWQYQGSRVEVSAPGGKPLELELKHRPSSIDLSDLSLEELKLLKKLGIRPDVKASE